ncbi:MAG: hypothetical protein IJW78_02035 [Clostridia bacterium]|nr:hypothetical protein [Clostridia bacterium]
MDNSRYYTSVTAYDYSLFTARESTAKALPKKKPVIKIPVKNKALRHSVSGVFSIIMVAVFMLSMICAEIYLRAEITSVRSQTAAVQNEIKELDSRETALQIQLEQKISYSNLEDEAKEMGMQKPRRDQIVYLPAEE